MKPKIDSTSLIQNTSTEPLLKWPGGKRRLIRFLLPLIPKTYGTYYEPFVGSGALFFALRPSEAVLSDKNPDLITTYRQVRNNPDAVISYLRRWKNNSEMYYSIRSKMPTNNAARAARLIYLSTLSFNGIHRVNLKGQFNVPYGKKKHLRPCDVPRLHRVSTTLKNARLKSEDFEDAVQTAAKGDFVYMDPPYTVAHLNNGFVKYNAKIFTWSDQERLARVARELMSRGCYVAVSNADHESIHTLYEGFALTRIERHSIIAASSTFRRRVTECIFHNL